MIQREQRTAVRSFLEGISQRHTAAINQHRAGKLVDPFLLWAAVGYFTEGSGRREKLGLTSEQWNRLREDTGRDPIF